ncbi:MAG TPA: cation:proton antiporter [Euryarchaeota archaeon]|nr:cation:proton antiporter [Euryarchaeota archaeon]
MMEDSFLLAAIIVSIYGLVVLLRLFLGPTPGDRVVAVDTLNTFVVAVMLLLGAAFKRTIYLDIATVYALLSYIGTLYIARYLEGGFKR